MNKDLMFSSKKEDWETPRELFCQLNSKYNFTLDAAATMLNKKCHHWLEDALNSEWRGIVTGKH